MKRLFASLLVLVLAASFSVAYVEQKYIGMDITAYNGTYSDFIIQTIKGAPTDAVGMPFFLTGADVQYSTSEATAGREIAQWSVHSNSTPIDIRIKAEPLKRVGDSGAETVFDENATPINYVLFFPYTYTCYDVETGKTKDVSGFMRVVSGEEEYSSRAAENAISNALVDKQGVRAGINTGTFPVRFMLSSDVTNINDRNNYPAGYYRANVTIVNSGT